MKAIFEFFCADHRRLQGLLDRAITNRDAIDLRAFEQFRGGLLKHIGMEEKVLLPAARRARGGEPLPLARQLRLEHGAIAALLVPTPNRAVIEKLVSVLTPHNLLEEQPGGLYEQCDELLDAESAVSLLEQLRSFPEVPLAPYSDGPLVELTIENAIRRARSE
jgi:hypothetical protein